jgi:hypothetical protein
MSVEEARQKYPELATEVDTAAKTRDEAITKENRAKVENLPPEAYAAPQNINVGGGLSIQIPGAGPQPGPPPPTPVPTPGPPVGLPGTPAGGAAPFVPPPVAPTGGAPIFGSAISDFRKNIERYAAERFAPTTVAAPKPPPAYQGGSMAAFSMPQYAAPAKAPNYATATYGGLRNYSVYRPAPAAATARYGGAPNRYGAKGVPYSSHGGTRSSGNF